MMFHMINVMFDKNNYLCLNESYQKNTKEHERDNRKD